MRHAFLPVAVLLFAGCPTLPPGTLPPPDEGLGEHWLRFVQISDPQLADEESPARAVRTDPLISAAWRPQEAYGVATLDATLAAINRLHAAGPPIDVVARPGDLCDTAQYNELRWFIDTMDGGEIDTDSGTADAAGRAANPADNPKLPYDAVGLDPAIPWYSIIGNHDVLATGNFPIDDSSNIPERYSAPLLRPVAALIGLHAISPHLNGFYPTTGQSPAVIGGLGPAYDAESLQIKVGKLRAGKLPADDARRFLTRRDFVAEHFNTTSAPAGHGFTEENMQTGSAFYTFRPNPAVPVRFIALDTVPPRIPRGYPAFYGVMTREEFEGRVRPALEAARLAGEYVVLLSHHPSGDFDLPFPARKLGAKEFRDYLAAQPHVLAHLAGHTHYNEINRIDGPYPYLEVITCAIIDYPQEGRLLDLYYNAETSTFTLASTMFGHNDAPTRLSAESFRRAQIDAEQGQAFDMPEAEYQALFQDAAKGWGLGGVPLPQENLRHAPAKRIGGAGDRTVYVQVRR